MQPTGYSKTLFHIFMHHKDSVSGLLSGLSRGQWLHYTTADDSDHIKGQRVQHSASGLQLQYTDILKGGNR